MQNKLLKNPVYKNSDGLKPNEFSQRSAFSSSVGQLLPIYYDLLLPGDKVTINDQMTTRTLTLKSAVMCDLTDVIDYFFIPLEQIYSLFGSFVYGVDDRKSSLVANKANISRYFPTFDLTQVLNLADSDWNNDLSLINGTFDDVREHKLNGLCRLFDCFGIDINQYVAAINSGDLASSSFPSFPLQPMFFLAYQKCYFDYYRIDDFQENNPSAFNIDRYYSRTALITPTSDDMSIFTLRHRPWQRDFFKNVFQTPLIPAGSNGGATEIGATNSLINNQFMSAVDQWLSGQTSFKTVNQGANGSASLGSNTVSIAADAQNPSTTFNSGQLNVANLRSMFALDKLLEITRRAGKNYDLQTLAHFGVKTDNFNSSKVYYLGSHESPIIVRDVIATADGTNGSQQTNLLGQVSGKGYGYKRSDRPIRFSAKEHGIILGIYSCVPKLDYAQTWYDKLHTYMDRVDFPTPEFMNLGMVPMFTHQMCINADSKSPTSSINDFYSFGQFMNWTYRYIEYKDKPNRVFGSLKYDQHMWKPQEYLNYFSGYLYNQLIPPTYLNGTLAIDYSDYFMGQPTNAHSDTNWNMNTLYSRDPLLHEFVFDVVKSSKISQYGLPQL